jgi:hypothetical protein
LNELSNRPTGLAKLLLALSIVMKAAGQGHGPKFGRFLADHE